MQTHVLYHQAAPWNYCSNAEIQAPQPPYGKMATFFFSHLGKMGKGFRKGYYYF